MPQFDYSVRVSHRARHARIVVRPNLSVEVVLPKGVAKSRAARLVCEKRGWVERSLKRFRAAMDEETQFHTPFPPQKIDIELLHQPRLLIYRKSDSSQVRVTEQSDELHITGAIDDEVKLRAALQRWLKLKAKKTLLPMLEALAREHGFHFNKATIRLQRSRWGSCSKAGNISLNAKLLFLPQELVRYVIVHELAHLKEMNHSAAFWRVVERCDADYGDHRRAMCRVAHRIPKWADT